MAKKSFGSFVKKATKTIVGYSSLCCLSMVVTLSVVDFQSVKQIPQIPQRFKDVDKSLFMQNVFGLPYMLPIKNGVVELNILNQFSKAQQKEIKTGIMELDILAEGFNYTVTDSTTHRKNAINIEVVPHTGNEVIATTKYTANMFGTSINYPITIQFNEKYLESKNIDLSKVMKHELLHTLGFEDLYEKEDQDHIMYYQELDCDMNDEEIRSLNTVYDAKYTGYKVGKPTTVNYVFEDETETNSNETLEDDNTMLHF